MKDVLFPEITYYDKGYLQVSDIYNIWYGMRETFPDAWNELCELLPIEERTDIAQV